MKTKLRRRRCVRPGNSGGTPSGGNSRASGARPGGEGTQSGGRRPSNAGGIALRPSSGGSRPNGVTVTPTWGNQTS